MNNIPDIKEAFEKFLYFFKSICWVDLSLSFDRTVAPAEAGALPCSLSLHDFMTLSTKHHAAGPEP